GSLPRLPQSTSIPFSQTIFLIQFQTLLHVLRMFDTVFVLLNMHKVFFKGINYREKNNIKGKRSNQLFNDCLPRVGHWNMMNKYFLNILGYKN
ncbi:hypothetical protein ACJX0J_041551, partial [Zea mays]